ncbi:MAG: TlyA family RNA methyltransferase [Lachnospiraceae bacterium]|nr:TlyA family RNA methyltransferase [Lachnospiraceae bacterium]
MKERLDKILCQLGYAPSREKAKAIIMSGNVFVNGQREDKAGDLFEQNNLHIEVKSRPLPYVSRGGLKLEKAIRIFDIDLVDKVCMDIGASTGGFTDCMLQNGASKVYSIDVGYGQFDWKLRTDPRVICIEKTNFRYFSIDQYRQFAPPQEWIDFASADVSFISLSKILAPAYDLLHKEAHMVCLIKPQFESGREHVGKKGVVKDPTVHEQVIQKVLSNAKEIGFTPIGLDYSPVKGPEGNIEYLLYLQKGVQELIPIHTRIHEVVEASHAEL